MTTDEHRFTEQGIGDLSSQDLDAIEVILASRYRHVLTDPRMFNEEYGYAGRNMRSRIERVLGRQPSDTDARRASERDFIRMAVMSPAALRSGPRTLKLEVRAAIVMFARALTLVALLAVVTAVAFRGGLMRAIGLELVTANGQPASRGQILVRTVIALAPVFLLVVTTQPGELGASAAMLLVMLVGAVYAIVHPERGVQDRLAGTWIVPR